MKGANTELCAANIAMPKIPRARRIGNSQSFLRTRRNIHTSLTKDIKMYCLGGARQFCPRTRFQAGPVWRPTLTKECVRKALILWNLIEALNREIGSKAQRIRNRSGAIAPAHAEPERLGAGRVPCVRRDEKGILRGDLQRLWRHRVNFRRRLVLLNRVDRNDMREVRFDAARPNGGFEHRRRAVRKDRQRSSLESLERGFHFRKNSRRE